MIFNWGRAPKPEKSRTPESNAEIAEREWSIVQDALEGDAIYFDDIMKDVALVFVRAGAAYQASHPEADVNALSRPFDQQVWIKFGKEQPTERKGALTRIFVDLPSVTQSALETIRIKYSPVMDAQGIRSHEVDRAVTLNLIQWFDDRYAGLIDMSINTGPEEGTSLTLSVRSIKKGIALAEYLKVTSPETDSSTTLQSSPKSLEDKSLD